MLFPEHFLTVRATVKLDKDAQFNHWYNTEHTPDAVKAFKGCIGAARYKVVLGNGDHQYMAMYAFPSADVMNAALAGPEIKELIRIYDADVGAFSTRERTTYSKIFEYMAKE